MCVFAMCIYSCLCLCVCACTGQPALCATHVHGQTSGEESSGKAEVLGAGVQQPASNGQEVALQQPEAPHHVQARGAGDQGEAGACSAAVPLCLCASVPLCRYAAMPLCRDVPVLL